jgi:hypothetical protein
MACRQRRMLAAPLECSAPITAALHAWLEACLRRIRGHSDLAAVSADLIERLVILRRRRSGAPTTRAAPTFAATPASSAPTSASGRQSPLPPDQLLPLERDPSTQASAGSGSVS